jgi:hypothetical protein
MVCATWSENHDTGCLFPAALQYLARDVTAHPRSLLRCPSNDDEDLSNYDEETIQMAGTGFATQDCRSAPMDQSFLEEQLKRIKDMTEQMSRARTFRETDEVRNQSPRDRETADDAEPARRPVPRGTRRRS